MWHKPCRTFHPWCLCIKTLCLLPVQMTSNAERVFMSWLRRKEIKRWDQAQIYTSPVSEISNVWLKYIYKWWSTEWFRESRRPFWTPLLTGLTLMPAWISNPISIKVCDEITYSISNFNGSIVEVWGWINNVTPYFTGAWSTDINVLLLTEINVCISYCIHCFLWDVITQQWYWPMVYMRLIHG